MRTFILTAAACAAMMLMLIGLVAVISLGVWAGYHADSARAACTAAHADACNCHRPNCDCGCRPRLMPIAPLRRGDGLTGSIEVGSTSGRVNEQALSETKNGECLPCRRPASPRPSAVASVPSDPTTESKQGAFQCEVCKQATVGEEWQELWADDSTSLTCVCKQCWAKLSRDQRKQVLSNFVERSALTQSQKFYAAEAIEQFSNR